MKNSQIDETKWHAIKKENYDQLNLSYVILKKKKLMKWMATQSDS